MQAIFGVQSVGEKLDNWQCACERHVAALAGAFGQTQILDSGSHCGRHVWLHLSFRLMLLRRVPRYYSRQRLFGVGIGHVNRGMDSRYDAHIIPDATEDNISVERRVRNGGDSCRVLDFGSE